MTGRLICLAAVALAWLGSALPAVAACSGKDLFEELRTEAPEKAAALTAQAGGVIHGRGRFWRISRDGVAPSYVLGTYHVAQAVDMLPDGVWSALENARVAVFEVSQDDQRAMERRLASNPELSLDADAEPFSERFEGRDLVMLRLAFGARGVSLQQAERLRPWIQFSLLTFPPCQLQVMQGGAEMLDNLLARRASELGIEEVGLEDPIGAVALLDAISPADRDTMMLAAARLAALEEDAFATALAFYRDGRIGLLPIFSEWMVLREAPDLDIREANRRLYAELLDGRNAKWMPRLLEEVEKGNAFIAVGALHLVGENGLIAAFERAGYIAERLDEPGN